MVIMETQFELFMLTRITKKIKDSVWCKAFNVFGIWEARLTRIAPVRKAFFKKRNLLEISSAILYTLILETKMQCGCSTSTFGEVYMKRNIINEKDS